MKSILTQFGNARVTLVRARLGGVGMLIEHRNSALIEHIYCPDEDLEMMSMRALNDLHEAITRARQALLAAKPAPASALVEVGP